MSEKMEKVLLALLFAVGLSVIALVGTFIVMAIRSNGETDYCYVQMYSPAQMAPQWMLYAHRPWLPDRQLGIYPTLSDAANIAHEMGCKLNSK